MNNSNDLFALLLARTKSGGGGGGSDDYRDLSHKPQINNHTLDGSMTSADLGITSANDTTITVKVTGETDQTFTTNQSSASNITVNVPVRDVTVGGTSALDTSTHTVALGSAAGSATTDFATSAQGGKADSAVQTLTINNSATGVTKTGDAVDISAVPATIVSAGKLANNMEATTQSASDNSDKLATTKYVDTAVGNLPKPMVYTGAITLTADSTDTTKASITVTAPASASNIKEGFTYKVATIASSPAYTGTLKVGDTFIAAKNAPTVSASWVADTDWNVIPSGDEPSGTVIQVSTGAGLTGGPVTTSGTIKANLQSETAFGGAATSVTPGSITTNIQPVLTDSNGKLAVKVDKSDVGLGNVTNDAQVKKISSSVNNNIVKWGGTDGATVADSGVSISTSVADNDTTVPTGKAVTTELNKKQNTLTAGAGLAFGTGVDANKLGHSNSVTAQTTSSVKKFTYDAYGHVTGSSELSTAESDALASGIDSTKVAQIETNKNNILSIQEEQVVQNREIATLREITNCKLYGYRIDKQDTNPDARVTYLYDAVGMTPAYMDFSGGSFNYGSWGDIWFIAKNRPVALKYDGTVDYELSHTDFTKKIDGETASDVSDSTYGGNFMSEIPLVYVKRWKDTRYNYVVFCETKPNDDYLAQAHTNANGTVNPYIYLPMFKGSIDANNKLRSLMGTIPNGNTTAANEVTYVENCGNGWQLWDKAKIDLIMDLIVLITKSTNCRGKIGNGDCQTYNASDTRKDSKNNGANGKMMSGYEVGDTTRSTNAQFYGSEGTDVTNYGKHHMIAFYIEDLWANRWDRCLGFNLVDNVYKVKMTPPYTLDSDSTYQTLSVTPPSSTEGWLKNVSSGVYGDVPTEVGASNTSGFANYFYKNASGARLSLFGGNADRGLLVGRYWYLGSGATFSYCFIGGSPCYNAL